jgi:type III restriction enzyme
MMQHYRETPMGEDGYEVRVTHGYTLLRPQPFNVPNGQSARDFKQAVTPASETESLRAIFELLLSAATLRLRSERRLAVLLDADATVEKWMKPGKAQFQIDFRSGEAYEPISWGKSTTEL